MSEELLDARADKGAHDEDEEYDTGRGDGDSSKFARVGETVAIVMLHLHISFLHGDLLNLSPGPRQVRSPGHVPCYTAKLIYISLCLSFVHAK